MRISIKARENTFRCLEAAYHYSFSLLTCALRLRDEAIRGHARSTRMVYNHWSRSFVVTADVFCSGHHFLILHGSGSVVWSWVQEEANHSAVIDF